MFPQSKNRNTQSFEDPKNSPLADPSAATNYLIGGVATPSTPRSQPGPNAGPSPHRSLGPTSYPTPKISVAAKLAKPRKTSQARKLHPDWACSRRRLSQARPVSTPCPHPAYHPTNTSKATAEPKELQILKLGWRKNPRTRSQGGTTHPPPYPQFP